MPRAYFRIAQETTQEKEKRLEGQRLHRADRQEKLERTRYKGAKDDVQLANVFRQFGIDYLNTPKELVYDQLKGILVAGSKLLISQEAEDFLKEHFGEDIRLTKDFNGKISAKFLEGKRKGEDSMSLITDIAERSGQTRKVVRIVFESFLKTIRIGLKNERYVRIPDFGRLKLSFRPAKEKRKGMNPFTGKKQWFKARPASNKLRFSPAKSLKTYVMEKVEVVAPKKKKKKSKKSE